LNFAWESLPAPGKSIVNSASCRASNWRFGGTSSRIRRLLEDVFGLFRGAIDDLPSCRSSSENLKELKYLSDYAHRTGEGERQFDLVAMHTRTRSG